SEDAQEPGGGGDQPAALLADARADGEERERDGHWAFSTAEIGTEDVNQPRARRAARRMPAGAAPLVGPGCEPSPCWPRGRVTTPPHDKTPTGGLTPRRSPP